MNLKFTDFVIGRGLIHNIFPRMFEKYAMMDAKNKLKVGDTVFMKWNNLKIIIKKEE